MFKSCYKKLFLIFFLIIPQIVKTQEIIAYNVNERKVPITQAEANAIAIEAYIYLYPLITMELTRKQFINSKAVGKIAGAGPINTFNHIRKYPDASFKSVVRPNFDTLYSIAWLDLSNGPIVLSVPAFKDRFYFVSMYDMFTNIFSTIGTQTTGTQAGNYLISGPDFNDKPPKNLKQIMSPSSKVWIIVRTQTNGEDDYDKVHTFQNKLKLTSLLDFEQNKKSTFKTEDDLSVDSKTPPLDIINSMSAQAYFSLGAKLLTKYPMQFSDYSMRFKMARIGLYGNDNFKISKLNPILQKAYEQAPKKGLQEIKDFIPKMAPVINGWQTNIKTMGVYGNDYLKRATVTFVGLGAIPPQDAVYPILLTDSKGNKIEGGKKYKIHFDKEEIPPAEAFWSITMYDQDGFAVENKLNRYVIGSRDPLHYNNDGSLDIYIQHQSPGKEKESNWLPSPASGEIGITMRIYVPKDQVLIGDWNPTPVIEDSSN